MKLAQYDATHHLYSLPLWADHSHGLEGSSRLVDEVLREDPVEALDTPSGPGLPAVGWCWAAEEARIPYSPETHREYHPEGRVRILQNWLQHWAWLGKEHCSRLLQTL